MDVMNRNKAKNSFNNSELIKNQTEHQDNNYRNALYL